MKQNVTQKLLESHLVTGKLEPGEEIGLRIDQTLTQDATGTMVMLELEAMGLDRVETELSVQYVDHNLIQQDYKNPDDHLFLKSACERFGLWYSRAGNGVSHPVQQQNFGRPGRTLLGSDSHTPAGGALGMLAIGAGGLEVAMAMAGQPFFLKTPAVWGVELIGELPPWVSAKDVILEMLRRHGVKGGVGRVVEYFGPGLEGLSAMDRHVIANMGAELGATSTVFPADEEVRRYLRAQGREGQYDELLADAGADYDIRETIDLSALEPLVALPTSPGNVVPVREVAGREIHQAYIGSSANPGYRDIAIVAEMVAGRQVPPQVSLDINPASRQALQTLIRDGKMLSLLSAGARVHQPGCNGCIGMGQAPATGTISVRTVPRNFPGRSGTKGDQVYLASPETAAASALTGVITDPRTLDIAHPTVAAPADPIVDRSNLVEPLPVEAARSVELRKGPNISSLPRFEPLPDELSVPILLTMGDDISTDEILPAGTRVLPFRSNIEKISEFAFDGVDDSYPERAREVIDDGGHAVVGGHNYGQGSSREHAALAPRFLGLRLVIAKSFARIHWQNLVNFGVLPLTLVDEADVERLEQDERVSIDQLWRQLDEGDEVEVTLGEDRSLRCRHGLSSRQIELLRAGSLFGWARTELDSTGG